MASQQIKEELLHYVWRTKRFDHDQLATAYGQPISINNYGRYNHDAGPDFLEGAVHVGETLWAGQIEMHVRSSDWCRHGHQNDRQYDNVILHVVYDHDQEVLDRSGKPLPVLILADRIDEHTLGNYQALLNSTNWIACAGMIDQVPDIKKELWLDSLIGERLEQKSAEITALLTIYKGDWEAVTYHAVSKALGLTVNVDPMDRLARAIPLRTLLKHRDSLVDLEAILLGTAGILGALQQADSYSRDLTMRFNHLKAKYKLNCLPADRWRYSRMRPVNFPDIRLAQLAALLHETASVFQYIRDQSLDKIKALLSISASSYWDNHYRIAVNTTDSKPKRLGKLTIDRILINTVAPLLFAYGRQIDNHQYCEKATDLLYAMPAEQNRVLRRWADLGINAANAAHGQSLLHLKKHYCDRLQCLRCSIGAAVVMHRSSLTSNDQDVSL